MSFFERQTRTVPIDAKNKITIRKLTWGEQQEAISAATIIVVKGGDTENPDVKIDAPLLQLEQTTRAVESWEGPGFDGREPTRDNIRALPPEIGAKLSDAVDDLNRDLEPEEKKSD